MDGAPGIDGAGMPIWRARATFGPSYYSWERLASVSQNPAPAVSRRIPVDWENRSWALSLGRPDHEGTGLLKTTTQHIPRVFGVSVLHGDGRRDNSGRTRVETPARVPEMLPVSASATR